MGQFQLRKTIIAINELHVSLHVHVHVYEQHDHLVKSIIN